jgi:hypothetical protein
VTGRRGRRSKQVVGGINGRRRYGKLKTDPLDRTVWITRF